MFLFSLTGLPVAPAAEAASRKDVSRKATVGQVVTEGTDWGPASGDDGGHPDTIARVAAISSSVVGPSDHVHLFKELQGHAFLVAEVFDSADARLGGNLLELKP